MPSLTRSSPAEPDRRGSTCSPNGLHDRRPWFQSGERFEGVDNFRQWREQYPTPVAFHLRRITGSGDVWVSEASISYDGGPPTLGVSVHEFRSDRIVRERIYVAEPWDAPEWRAPWRAAATAD